MAFGSAVAMVMAAIFLSLGNPLFRTFDLLHYLAVSTVLPASIWAFVLFGPYTRNLEIGPAPAMLVGVACVLLAALTVPLTQVIQFLWKNKEEGFDLRLELAQISIVFSFDLSIYFFTSLAMALLLQWAGAGGGFVIWQLTKGKRHDP